MSETEKKLSGINSAGWEIRSRMFLLIGNYPESKTREFSINKNMSETEKKIIGDSAAWEIRLLGYKYLQCFPLRLDLTKLILLRNKRNKVAKLVRYRLSFQFT
ncbi:hypothetical protein NQ317_012647 [Molorchus minor]|uniref:Uncharacterized protein n=1 Tax=Molorchus minor TaxID=1323400 RepID=A0ABQ9J1N9_9CUCU|nr:hypothetical protein NQ317_012647 [Molorchus minor]